MADKQSKFIKERAHYPPLDEAAAIKAVMIGVDMKGKAEGWGLADPHTTGMIKKSKIVTGDANFQNLKIQYS